MDTLDRMLAENRDKFGRDYISASHGTEIPADNMEELLKSAEPDLEKEEGRIVMLASDSSFQSEMKIAKLKGGRGNSWLLG